MKGIIKNQMLAEAQSSGWMCDFGEYLPFDAVMDNVQFLRNDLAVSCGCLYRLWCDVAG